MCIEWKSCILSGLISHKGNSTNSIKSISYKIYVFGHLENPIQQFTNQHVKYDADLTVECAAKRATLSTKNEMYHKKYL
jgi:hypothetical protein